MWTVLICPMIVRSPLSRLRPYYEYCARKAHLVQRLSAEYVAPLELKWFWASCTTKMPLLTELNNAANDPDILNGTSTTLGRIERYRKLRRCDISVGTNPQFLFLKLRQERHRLRLANIQSQWWKLSLHTATLGAGQISSTQAKLMGRQSDPHCPRNNPAHTAHRLCPPQMN